MAYGHFLPAEKYRTESKYFKQVVVSSIHNFRQRKYRKTSTKNQCNFIAVMAAWSSVSRTAYSELLRKRLLCCVQADSEHY